MGFLSEVIAWFTEPGRWLGDGGIVPLTIEHLLLAMIPMMLATAAALPAAVWLAHRRKAEFLANAVVNVGRAIPSFGIIIIAGVLFANAGVSLKFWPAIVALFALAVPPMFTNAYAAIANVPAETVEAARGVGYEEKEVLWRVEVPVGSPVVLAGVRISLLQVLATVPLAAVLSSGGGLGQFIVQGFAKGPAGIVEVFSGALLIAALTLAMDRLFTVGESAMLPAGVRRVSLQDAGAWRLRSSETKAAERNNQATM